MTAVTTVVPMLIIALNFCGSYLVGNKIRQGWWFHISTQIIWLPYGYITGQWAFMAASIVWAGLFVRNLARWTKDDSVSPGPADEVVRS